LGRQHQVHAQRATPLGDADEPGQEGGQLLGQPGELVDDDHQAGQLHRVGQGGEVRCAVGGEEGLAAGELGGE
jgi:hypothetical protein